MYGARPFDHIFKALADHNMITDAEYQAMDKEQREIILAAIKFADESAWPDPITLGEDVFAPNTLRSQ